MTELIYFNGSIITMESPEPSAEPEALLIRDGKIAQLGTVSDILRLRTNHTKVIDLMGKTLMPAFIDAHSHISALAATLAYASLEGAKSFDEIEIRLNRFIAQKQPKQGEWIVGFGYDHNILAEKRHPDKELLDAVSVDHPIVISHASGHMGAVNSLALQQMNITQNTPDPEGGMIGRIPGSDEPSGYLEETAFTAFTNSIPKPTLDQRVKLLKEAQHTYVKYGITTVQEGFVREEDWAGLKAMAEGQQFVVDVIGYIDMKNSSTLVQNEAKYVKKNVNRLKIGGYKIFLDGSPQGRTAWLSQPYEDAEDGYRGYPIYEDQEVERLVRIAYEEELQLLTHCNGDAAAEQLIQAFEHVLSAGNHDSELRPVMIHAQTVRKDQIQRMKPIHMIPSFFIAHVYYWGDIHIKNLGKERAFKISPAKTAIKEDVVYTFHQDSPVVPPNMLHTVWCAVNRITKNGVLLGETERITPYEALKGVTINAAYQYVEEHTKGSIKEGKLADLIILDQNPLQVDPIKIKDIRIMETIKEGKTVYSALT